MNTRRTSSHKSRRPTEDERRDDQQDQPKTDIQPTDRSDLEAAMSTSRFASTDLHSSLSTPSHSAPSQSYRQLVTRGLTPGEAGTLTAYLEGLDVAHHTWTLREVNSLLFLRHLRRTNQFGERDGEAVEAPGGGR
jgi:hypothetical protein